jgi:hypothetical protein
MSEVTTVASVQAATKPFIIGKEWLTSRNGQYPGRIVLSNRLPCDIVLKPGSVINRFANVKRTEADADFTLSITLPAAEADNLIALQKQMKVA